MESDVKSPSAGKIVALHVAVGDTVQTGEPLVTIA
jgi:pyruvate carboxylase subunit B